MTDKILNINDLYSNLKCKYDDLKNRLIEAKKIVDKKNERILELENLVKEISENSISEIDIPDKTKLSNLYVTFKKYNSLRTKFHLQADNIRDFNNQIKYKDRQIELFKMGFVYNQTTNSFDFGKDLKIEFIDIKGDDSQWDKTITLCKTWVEFNK